MQPWGHDALALEQHVLYSLDMFYLNFSLADSDWECARFLLIFLENFSHSPLVFTPIVELKTQEIM